MDAGPPPHQSTTTACCRHRSTSLLPKVSSRCPAQRRCLGWGCPPAAPGHISVTAELQDTHQWAQESVGFSSIEGQNEASSVLTPTKAQERSGDGAMLAVSPKWHFIAALPLGLCCGPSPCVTSLNNSELGCAI